MKPSPVWQAEFPDGIRVKAGNILGRVVVWSPDRERESALKHWVEDRADYTWEEGLVFNTGATWALPYTMTTLFPDATITLVDGIPDPLPEHVQVTAPIPGEQGRRYRHLRVVK